MNNSLNIDLSPEFPEETGQKERLREREAKLVRTIEALVGVSQSNEWSSLKTELFDKTLETVEQKLRLEAEKPEVCLPELYRLQGERKWARRYADPLLLVEEFRVELAHIRKQLNPPTAGEQA